MSTTDTPNLPFLSKQTFAEAITHLIAHISTYSPHLTYELKHSPYDPSETYLEITKPLSLPTSEPVGIELDIEADEDDPESLPPPTNTTTHTITYSITLSPIYSVPILHFHLEPGVYDLDTIYEVLVPEKDKEVVRGLGVQGGISQTVHPYTGKTVWFVHPCRTAEVMGMFELDLERYMGIWVGVVGGVVGLVL